jgi:hypothetical protein
MIKFTTVNSHNCSIDLNTYTYIHIYQCYICRHTHIHKYMYIHMHISMLHLQTNTHTRTHIYLYIYISLVHLQTHTHTRMPSLSLSHTHTHTNICIHNILTLTVCHKILKFKSFWLANLIQSYINWHFNSIKNFTFFTELANFLSNSTVKMIKLIQLMI